jgi:hypothetical protein
VAREHTPPKPQGAPSISKEFRYLPVNRDLILGALTASARSLADSSDFDPVPWGHLFTAKAARCNAAFMLALGNVEIALLLDEIAAAVDASKTTDNH